MPYADRNIRRAHARIASAKYRSLHLDSTREYAKKRAAGIRLIDVAAYNKAQRSYRSSWDDEMRVRDAIRQRNVRLLRYGLTPDMFSRLLETQGSACAICRTQRWGKKGPMIDHDHKTKKVRGILCNKCNLGIGHMDDSVDILEHAIDYLKQHHVALGKVG